MIMIEEIKNWKPALWLCNASVAVDSIVATNMLAGVDGGGRRVCARVCVCAQAVYGSRLFHPRTFLPLLETGVPMLIRNTIDREAPGTLISTNGCDGPTTTRKPTCAHAL